MVLLWSNVDFSIISDLTSDNFKGNLKEKVNFEVRLSSVILPGRRSDCKCKYKNTFIVDPTKSLHKILRKICKDKENQVSVTLKGEFDTGDCELENLNAKYRPCTYRETRRILSKIEFVCDNKVPVHYGMSDGRNINGKKKK
uniref:Ribonuclease A-domain domain-containing protein n=1 Tax=Oryzias sinensis TaxID=183150 RepID=A0A8C7XPF5_9TELE